MFKRQREEAIKYIFGLKDIPAWYVLVAVILITIIAVITKKLTTGLLTGCVLIILYETVICRSAFEGQHFQPRLFWSYGEWEAQKDQIIANIIMFIPLGICAGRLLRWKGIIVGLTLSISIELLQFVSRRGLFEFDDILHNTFGAVTGVSIYVLVETMIKNERDAGR